MMNDVVALDSIARSLSDITRELGRINNSLNLITSLEAEIVLDIHTRRAAERASFAAYHATSLETEQELTDGKNVLPEEQPA